VPVLSVAELKTSLQPSAAPLVGEFLTYALFLYHTRRMQSPTPS
jgi:hypothetical protein